MNCSELDRVVADVHVLVHDEDPAFAVVSAAVFILGILLIVKGERLVRPLAAIVGGTGATVATFVVTSAATTFDCNARLVVSAAAGLVAAMFGLCVFRSGLFILGAGAFGSVTHLVYDSLPVDLFPNPPFVLSGRSGYYYMAMAVAILVGATIAWCQKREFVRVTSSLLGGGTVAFGVWLVSDRTGSPVTSLVLLVVLTTCTFVGVIVQRWDHARRTKKEFPQRRPSHEV